MSRSPREVSQQTVDDLLLLHRPSYIQPAETINLLEVIEYFASHKFYKPLNRLIAQNQHTHNPLKKINELSSTKTLVDGASQYLEALIHQLEEIAGKSSFPGSVLRNRRAIYDHYKRLGQVQEKTVIDKVNSSCPSLEPPFKATIPEGFRDGSFKPRELGTIYQEYNLTNSIKTRAAALANALRPAYQQQLRLEEAARKAKEPPHLQDGAGEGSSDEQSVEAPSLTRMKTRLDVAIKLLENYRTTLMKDQQNKSTGWRSLFWYASRNAAKLNYCDKMITKLNTSKRTLTDESELSAIIVTAHNTSIDAMTPQNQQELTKGGSFIGTSRMLSLQRLLGIESAWESPSGKSLSGHLGGGDYHGLKQTGMTEAVQEQVAEYWNNNESEAVSSDFKGLCHGLQPEEETFQPNHKASLHS